MVDGGLLYLNKTINGRVDGFQVKTHNKSTTAYLNSDRLLYFHFMDVMSSLG